MSNRLLVKLLPSVSLAAADPRANLRPLYDSAPQTAAFGIGAEPAWFLADMPEGAATPWDLAHIYTGYDRGHEAQPQNLLQNLERSFVDGDGDPKSANDTNRGHAFPDNSGHGTGTISILAGGQLGQFNERLGGAPDADILPL